MDQVNAKRRLENGSPALGAPDHGGHVHHGHCVQICRYQCHGRFHRRGRLSLCNFTGLVAAIFELALVLAFLTGAYFREAALLAAVYVIFLGFAFHGPSHWTDAEGLNFGAFVSHFPFAAGLLFAAVHGPGHVLALNRGWLK